MRTGLKSRRAFLASVSDGATAFVLTAQGGRVAAAVPRLWGVPDAVDRYVAAECKAHEIAGLAVAVIQHDKLVKAGAYGIADLEHEVPVTPHTRFHLDSLSKLFSAVAVMQLAEQGKLTLDDPISRCLDGLQPSWSAITVRHLLTHSSGIVDDYAEEFHGSMLVSYDNKILFEYARSRGLEFQPGDKARYNNLGFFLLTMIIERASGLSSQAYIERYVLARAGMAESGWPSLDDIVPNLAQPYTRTAAGMKHFRDYMASQASFSYSGVSTVLDLALFATALQDGRLISRASRAEMERPFRLNDGTNAQFGLAWELASYRGHPTIAKSGHSGALLTRFPERNLTVIALANVASQWPAFSYQTLTHTIAGFYDPKLVRNERADPRIDETVKSHLQRAFSQFLDGETQTEAFSRPWLEAFTSADRAMMTGIMAEASQFDVVACDEASIPGWTSYGIPIARTYSVRITNRASLVLFTLSFLLNNEGKVVAIETD
jgi:CubicO group peptidase (beta-lactamase class C family)